MHELTIELGARSYPVLTGDGLLSDGALLAPVLGSRSLVVTSETVAGFHLDTLRAALGEHAHHVLVLPDGESAKTLQMVERIVDAAADAGLGRDGTLIALGGGTIGDVTGLAAALYHRGIGYIQVPTTLLAQVDSSVGGKTAVNHRSGKNVIGAFHQPRLVLADAGVLRTLSDRELRAGIAEAIKSAVLSDDGMFEWLESRVDALRSRDPDALAETVRRCCALKARIVSADETERGARALLNLGHTFGHALETCYTGRLLHGEAVALGCVMAARMSQSLGWLPAAAAARITALVSAAGLPVRLPAPAPDADALLAQMGRDKKVAAGRVRLVLLRGIGVPDFTADYPHAALVLTLRDFTSDAA